MVVLSSLHKRKWVVIIIAKFRVGWWLKQQLDRSHRSLWYDLQPWPVGGRGRDGRWLQREPGCIEQLFRCSWSNAVAHRASASARVPPYLHRIRYAPAHSLPFKQRSILNCVWSIAFIFILKNKNSAVQIFSLHLLRSREVKPHGKLFFSVVDATTFTVHIPRP